MRAWANRCATSSRRSCGPSRARSAITELQDPVERNTDLQRLALDQVRFPKDAPLLTLVAVAENGELVDLTSRVGADRVLDWVAPAGRWRLDAVFLGWHGKMVERAAPGGEGRVIDHFSQAALQAHLVRFEQAFAGRELTGLRAFFNDSYEVDDAAGQADGTPALLDEFAQRRGYDLRPHLAALFGEGDPDTAARVLADYRETVSDLLLERFTRPWQQWAAARGALVRNQAHGAPASLLDLYAASDIPETEGRDPQRMRWAVSAAHVAGRPLVSAEAATWLGEHFRSTLADVREALDDYFLAGANHVVYHGTSYAPPGAPWPGWPFYAAVHFEPQAPWWTDLGALNEYVTRTQSFLQAGQHGNDVLLYYPLHDALAVRGSGLLAHFGSDRPEQDGSIFLAAAKGLAARGFAFDFVSDRQVRALRTSPGGALRTGGVEYRTILVPACRYIPLETFEALVELARAGATVGFVGGLPGDVAGLHQLAARRARYRALVDALAFAPAGGALHQARIGSGCILRGDDREAILARAGVAREELVDLGLRFARRRLGSDWCYFVAHRGSQALDAWVPLAVAGTSITLFDPLDGSYGRLPVRRSPAGRMEARLALEPGESRLLLVSPAATKAKPLPRYEPAAAPSAISGTWRLRFIEGGPELPPDLQIDNLQSWTLLGSESARSFSGTASYSISFGRPAGPALAWQLDLGAVRDSARVRLNGRDLGTLIGPPWRLTIPQDLLPAGNSLEVLVTNLPANRVAELDRRDPSWKRFYNVNFPARLPENRGADGLFSAASWKPLDSGLLGPVTITALRLAPATGESPAGPSSPAATGR